METDRTNLLMSLEQSGYERMLEVMNALGNRKKILVFECLDDWIHLTEIANRLGITNAYVSSIVKRFQDADIIDIKYVAGQHGVKKMVRKKWLNITLGFS